MILFLCLFFGNVSAFYLFYWLYFHSNAGLSLWHLAGRPVGPHRTSVFELFACNEPLGKSLTKTPRVEKTHFSSVKNKVPSEQLGKKKRRKNKYYFRALWRDLSLSLIVNSSPPFACEVCETETKKHWTQTWPNVCLCPSTRTLHTLYSPQFVFPFGFLFLEEHCVLY